MKNTDYKGGELNSLRGLIGNAKITIETMIPSQLKILTFAEEIHKS